MFAFGMWYRGRHLVVKLHLHVHEQTMAAVPRRPDMTGLEAPLAQEPSRGTDQSPPVPHAFREQALREPRTVRLSRAPRLHTPSCGH